MDTTWLQRFTGLSAQEQYVDFFLRLFLPSKAQIPHLEIMPNARATMSPTVMSLLNLPPELMLEIHDRLALDALLALKLTHPRFNQIISLDPRRWQTAPSHCSRRAIQTYLAPSTIQASHRYCKICVATIPISMFDSSMSSACIQTALTNTSKNIIELPPGICALHLSRLTRILHTRAKGSNEWVSNQSKLCMHCGNVQDWARCDCRCDSCTVGVVTTFTRYLNNTKECQQYHFWKDSVKTNGNGNGNGQLWVRETAIDENNQASIINLPVRPELDDATTKKQTAPWIYSPLFCRSFWS